MPDLRTTFPNFREAPHSPAIIIEGKPLSYSSLAALVDERCKRRVKPAIFEAAASLDCILDLLALWQLDLAAFPLNPRLPQQTRESLIERAGTDRLAAATLLATSGTTGTPKIAVLALENYLASAHSSAKTLKLGPGHSWHLSLPLFHVSGLSILFRCLVSGATIALDQDPLSSNATHFSLVPTQLFRILQDPEKIAFYKKAHCLLLGGAPLTSCLYEEALRAGLHIFTSWGMTETAAMATLNGKTLPHIEISLADDCEIRVRGPSLFQGYLAMGELSRPFDDDGWFSTRDLGAYDENGNLMWKGRKDNLFISGGENIQPEEIEQALGQLPEILEAIVVPIDDPEFGALPAAFIRTLSGYMEIKKIREALSLHLPRFKIPRHFFPLPDNSSLKPSRALLGQLARANRNAKW